MTSKEERMNMLNKKKNPPSWPMTDLEAVWKLTIPATLSLARMFTLTVSELGKILLPPSVYTKLTMMLSSSSGSESSKMAKMAVFLVSPIKKLMN